MLKQLQRRKDQSGFTIIEVLIVLAIAGLILLIVFLAVPALQRSSRNTQRKNDASAISSAVANYIGNNGGSVPTNVGGTGTDLKICGNSGCSGNTETAKLGYYDAAHVSEVNTTGAIAASKSTENVVIVKGYACNSDNTDVGNASARTAAIIYWTENGDSANPPEQCVEQ